jgi:hypothetical protein
MRTTRIALVVAGLLAGAWGLWLVLPILFSGDGPSLVAWLAGWPLLNDALLAPLAGGAGLLLARIAPPPWRLPLAAAALVTGMFGLLAVPLLVRPAAGPANPGLQTHATAAGLAIAVAVVWFLALLAGGVRAALARPAARCAPATPALPVAQVERGSDRAASGDLPGTGDPEPGTGDPEPRTGDRRETGRADP